MINQWLQQVVIDHNKTLGDVSIVFCSDSYLLTINQNHLQHDYYTDIITFDYCEGSVINGELYISIERVQENAKALNQLFYNELMRVIVHGVLHLVGHKDKTKDDETKMRRLEDHWLEHRNTRG